MSPSLIILGTFALIIACVLIPYFLFVMRPEMASEEQLRQRIRTGKPVGQSSMTILREVERLSSIPWVHDLLSGNNAAARVLRDTLQLSGVKVTPGQLVFGSMTF